MIIETWENGNDMEEINHLRLRHSRKNVQKAYKMLEPIIATNKCSYEILASSLLPNSRMKR